MLLRNAESRGTATYDLVLALAREARGEDPEGYGAEVITMVDRARMLSTKSDTAMEQ
jgi:Ca-activated chloride channel family protein